MKWMKINKHRILNPLTVAVLAISFYFALQNLNAIVNFIKNFFSMIFPFIFGFAISYILWRPTSFFERKMEHFWGNRLKKKRPHPFRIPAMIITYLIVGLAFLTVFSFVIPQVIQNLTLLSNNLPGYLMALEEPVNKVLSMAGFQGDVYQIMSDAWEKLSGTIIQFTSALLPWLLNLTIGITSTAMNTIVSVIVSIYLLADKERFQRQISKLLRALFPERVNRRIVHVGGIFDDTFGKYIIGQCLDALVVGTLCFLILTLFQLPYALLISVVVTVTNVIPYIGPFIGAIPGTFIILMTGGFGQMILFIFLIFVLQQIDGNILVPRIIGNSIGVSGFWVLFAILVGGGLFGILGVLLGVPSLSVLFQLIRMFVNRKLEADGQKETASPIGEAAGENPQASPSD